MLIECSICGDEFNPRAPEKKRVGGLINNCADCSEESTVKVIGLQAADGKQAQVQILSFNSDRDRQAYLNFWQNNTGLHKGKSCQLGTHLSTTPKVSFKTIQKHTPTNHKGKAT